MKAVSNTGLHHPAMDELHDDISMFTNWIERHGFEVIVFDMDCTMSTSHCGPGLPRNELAEYISNTSPDFIKALHILSTMKKCRSVAVKCAVATGSDPEEYNLHGQSQDTHILGPDLATAVIRAHCPEALELFEIMVGYDDRLHPQPQLMIPADTPHSYNAMELYENRKGKRHHMRLIQRHYDVPFHKMVLFDDTSLHNEDGWVAVKVEGKYGFRFSDMV